MQARSGGAYATVRQEMRVAAMAWLATLDEDQRVAAVHQFAADTRRQFTYLPRPRPGVCLADMTRVQRKAAHRLLATALSEPAYAQAATVMALEEVLDRQEGWRRGRHSDDFWLIVFGTPEGFTDEAWAWRWEGHHLSVTMTVDADGQIYPTPLFFGANPATVLHFGSPVLRPLGVEET